MNEASQASTNRTYWFCVLVVCSTYLGQTRHSLPRRGSREDHLRFRSAIWAGGFSDGNPSAQPCHACMHVSLRSSRQGKGKKQTWLFSPSLVLGSLDATPKEARLYRLCGAVGTVRIVGVYPCKHWTLVYWQQLFLVIPAETTDAQPWNNPSTICLLTHSGRLLSIGAPSPPQSAQEQFCGSNIDVSS
jgi:hypothetical protein